MKNLNFLVTVLAVILIFGACSKDDELPKKDHFITIEQAIEFAKENRGNTIVDENKISLRSDDFIPLNTISLDDDTGTAGLYIVNYRSNGEDYFNIISADSRINHVLAFGEGVVEVDDIKEGVSVWIEEQIKVIKGIREQNLTEQEIVTDVLQARKLPKDDEVDCCPACPNYPECLYDIDSPDPIGCGAPIDCHSESDPCAYYTQNIVVGPLMSTRWGQDCDYNADCPIMGCNQFPCGSNRALVGCVATSMSQIIRHHEHPAGYDYANMLDDYAALRADGDPFNDPTPAQVAAVAALTLDAGVEVNMAYGCNFSGAFTCAEVPGAMTGFFDYSQTLNCAGLSNFTHTLIRNEFDLNRPVIFRGNDNRGGHAWVGDGYIKRTDCYTGTDYQGNTIFYLSYTKMYHMNWGWNGVFNGWFDYSTWGGNFNTNQEVIHHIIP